MRIVYLNGEYLPAAEARISVFDRGFLFADAVYEVTAVIDGQLLDFDAHCQRLHRSLGELRIRAPMDDAALLAMHRELAARNALREGLIYLQISRGEAERDFLFPPADTAPTVVAFTQARPLDDSPAMREGIAVALVPDRRWGRRDIKTVQLLYPSMAKMQARAAGADDAWLVEDGTVTEGTSNNAWILSADGELLTRPLGEDILHGITRATVIRVAQSLQLRVVERPFSPAQARAAREAFVTSASGAAVPVVRIDGEPVGDGRPGELTRRLQRAYREQVPRRLL